MAQSLFILDLTYTSLIDMLDESMKAHIEFLDRHYNKGHFIISGRKVPREGGIIIAVAESKTAVESWMKDDPFHPLKLSKFTVTEFLTSGRSRYSENTWTTCVQKNLNRDLS